jgi:hypothetical protein
MSAGLINAVRDLTKRVDALEGRNTPVTGALGAVLAAIQDLTARIATLEQKRGPGRPPKDRDE